LGGSNNFKNLMLNRVVDVYRVPSFFGVGGFGTDFVVLPDIAFNDIYGDRYLWAKGTIIHEFSHVWDVRHSLLLSTDMNNLTHSFGPSCPGAGKCHVVYIGGIEEPPTIYARTNQLEDFAESVRSFFIPGYGILRPIRRKYITQVLDNHGLP